MVKLGDKVKDEITGFEGIITGVSDWLYGCRQVHVVSQDLDGGEPKSCWFDEQRVDLNSKVETGGPQPVPPKRH